MKLLNTALNALLTAALLATSIVAMAHGDEDHSKKAAGPVKKEQKDWGIAGDAKAVTRIIQIAMTDNMRFTPDTIDVKQGDVVKFVIRNNGKMLHEMVIGTKQVLDEHAALMVTFPTMEHEEPYMAHVPQGKSVDMIWNFNRPGEFDFACLIAGHYQAGMVGKIKVAASGKNNEPALAQAATSAGDMTEAEVRKVDKENRKITLKHGAIRNLDMPPMTMVFGVNDAAMLDKVQVGDKVQFKAANDAGKFTVIEIQLMK